MSSAFVVQEILQVLTVCFTYYDSDPAHNAFRWIWLELKEKTNKESKPKCSGTISIIFLFQDVFLIVMTVIL